MQVPGGAQVPGKVRLGHPGPAAGVTRTHPRPHLPARGQGQVSRAGGGTVGWGRHHQLSPSGPGAAPSTLSKADAGTSAHQQGTWPWGLSSVTAGGTREYGEWQPGSASLLSGSFAHFLSAWEPPYEEAQQAACCQGPQSLGSSALVEATSGAPWEGQGKWQPPN